jgi:hypothetical protein
MLIKDYKKAATELHYLKVLMHALTRVFWLKIHTK